MKTLKYAGVHVIVAQAAGLVDKTPRALGYAEAPVSFQPGAQRQGGSCLPCRDQIEARFARTAEKDPGRRTVR
ncbi:MAG: hypothetical protein ACLP7Q_19100 [Isosphaeraceae bacterium]